MLIKWKQHTCYIVIYYKIFHATINMKNALNIILKTHTIYGEKYYKC